MCVFRCQFLNVSVNHTGGERLVGRQNCKRSEGRVCVRRAYMRACVHAGLGKCGRAYLHPLANYIVQMVIVLLYNIVVVSSVHSKIKLLIYCRLLCLRMARTVYTSPSGRYVRTNAVYTFLGRVSRVVIMPRKLFMHNYFQLGAYSQGE